MKNDGGVLKALLIHAGKTLEGFRSKVKSLSRRLLFADHLEAIASHSETFSIERFEAV